MNAPGLVITNFHYGHMHMPEGNPSEYPKLIYEAPMSKNYRVVNSAAEEEAFLAGTVAPAVVAIEAAPAPTVVLSGDNDERTILLALAKEKGVKVDARWKTDKIRAAMAQAQPQVDTEN